MPVWTIPSLIILAYIREVTTTMYPTYESLVN